MSAATAPAASPRRRGRCLAIGAAVIIALWSIVGLFAPLLMPNDPAEFVSTDSFGLPSTEALLGTDYLGRDLLSRLIDAARITLAMGLAATILAHAIGGTLGLLAAIRGGWLDTVLSRIVDVLLSLPKIIVGLVVVAALGSSVVVLIGVAGIVYAAGVFRITRALGGDVAVLDYVRAARARGEGVGWLLFAEVLPNVVWPLAADFAIRLGFAILFMSSLSFLGLGIQPPKADWGGLVRENLSGLASGSLAPIFPALAIASVTISLNLLVDILGDRRGKEPVSR
ncbi:MAG: ABC transporter permease [Alphaproteobacteria bacterium]